MVNCLNLGASTLTASGCTEYFDRCCQRRCHNTECDGQCYFINIHTYTILRKICRGIVKDYFRAQYREKYTTLDGGNSVNVRIYRTRSRGGDHLEDDWNCHNASKLYESGILNKPDENVVGFDKRDKKLQYDKKSRSWSNKKETKDVNDFNVGKNCGIMRQFNGDDKFSRRSWKRSMVMDANKEADGVKQIGQVYEKDDPNFKSNKRNMKEENNQNYDYDKMGNTRRKPKKNIDKKVMLIYDDNYNKNVKYHRKSKKNNSIGWKVDEANADKEHRLRDKTKAGPKAERKKGKQNQNEADNYHDDTSAPRKGGAKSRKDDRGRTKDYNSIHGDRIKIIDKKHKKGTTVLNLDDNDNINSIAIVGYTQSINSNECKRGKGKSGMLEKSNRSKVIRGVYMDKNSNRESENSGFRFIKDLRKKINQGKSLDLGCGTLSYVRRSLKTDNNKIKKTNRIMNQLAEPLRYRQSKLSRGDEIKTCDYLRAFMEQRDLCRLDCRTHLCQCTSLRCNSQICNPCICPTSELSVFPQSIKNL